MLIPERNHHIPYSFELIAGVAKFINVDIDYYDFTNANYINLNNFLASVYWDNMYNIGNINSAVQEFYFHLYIGVSRFVPVK